MRSVSRGRCDGKVSKDRWRIRTIWNGNSLYREYPEMIAQMKERGCDAVNMDTLSIYAVAPVCNRDAARPIEYIYVGTVTDAMQSETDEWVSDLIEAVKRDDAHPHDGLNKFIVEALLPLIATV